MENGEFFLEKPVDGTEESSTPEQNEAPQASKGLRNADAKKEEREYEHEKQLQSNTEFNVLEGSASHVGAYEEANCGEGHNVEDESKHQMFLNELEESELKMAAQLEAVEASRQQQAAEFTAEVERLEQEHLEELQNALDAASQAQQQLHTLKVKQAEEIEYALAESKRTHNAEIQALRAELEEVNAKVADFMKEDGEGGKWKSLLPQYGTQISPEMKKELRLQKERLQRQHNCELKALEQRLHDELSLERDTLQAKLEEEYTAKLATVLTESALKNATQVEQISQQLRLEKQQAVSQLEEEQAARHEQEVARLAEERREAMEACRVEFEAARAEYQSKITELEVALASERESRVLEQNQEDWVEREERLRAEVIADSRRRVDEVQAECDRQKEITVTSLREALEQRLQTELRAAHQMHQQALLENQAQLQALYEKEVASVRENAQALQSEIQRDSHHEDIEALRTELVQENIVKFHQMTEKLQAVHHAELVTIQRERETEHSRQQEQVEKVREEMEIKLHHELEQLTQSHKAEVGHLQQQYQTQLDEMVVSHQQAVTQVHDSVEESIRNRLEQQHNSELQQLRNSHSAQLTVLEEEGAERLAEVSRELEQVKEYNNSLLTQLNIIKRELSEVQAVAEQQRGMLGQQEEEVMRLNQEVHQAGARERERQEQGNREHQEDTVSLAMLHKQLSTLTNEKAALQSSLAVLQSLVTGCVQLGALVEQTLSPSSEDLQAPLWHTPSALHVSAGVENASSDDGEQDEGEGREEVTLTPPVSTSPSSAGVGVANASSVVWTKNATNLKSSSTLRHTPSDDSGLASQQASVVNSEATMIVTPLVDGMEPTPDSPNYRSPHPPNLTILPLDDTALTHDMSHAPSQGLSYDQSQVGMLSISFLDATQPPPQPHTQPTAPVPTAQSGELSVEESLLPLNLPHFPALQVGLSHLHDAVSTLLQRYISISAEAADYQKKCASSTAELKEAHSSLELQAGHVSELEDEAKLREEKLTHTIQHMTNTQENLQKVVVEYEGMKGEVDSLRQQLAATQEALAASQQSETEMTALLRGKTEESDSHRHALESEESKNQQRVQLLDAQITQLQEELQAAQRNCASAIHEREAMHEENKRLASVQVTLEGQLHSLEVEAAARQRENEQLLKQKEHEIRELQVVRVELASHQEVQETLRAERDELQQRLGHVEHQLALCQAVPVEEQMSRIEQLTAREAQLTAELQQQTATSLALQERVKVAQDSLNQTAQENLSVKMGQAQLEDELRRLRDELQRRETALHRAQAESANQGRELDVALQELSQLRARMEEEREAGEDGTGSEGEQHEPQLQEAPNELALSLQQQREVESSLQTQIGLLKDTLNSKDRELEAMRMARVHQEQAIQQMKAQLTATCREEEEERRRGVMGLDQVEVTKSKDEEQSHTTVLSSQSSTSTILEEESSSRSILLRLAELAPVLSSEAHTVNQLTKNISLPVLSVEQLRASIDHLSHVVGTLSLQTDDGGENFLHVLEAVQNLVQELIVLLSTFDQGNTTQLTQQLSAVSELLCQLLSADRQALVNDTNTLRETIASVTSELEEAQSRLADYQQAEDSLERSAHTISSLHQELRASKEKEAELETAVEELSLSKSELGQQQNRAQVQHTATLSSMQEALRLERGTKDEVYAQLSAVQSELQQAHKAHLTDTAERMQLRQRLEGIEGELEQAKEVGRRAERMCGERETELGRVQALLQALGTDNREQGEHYSHLLENERRMVMSLRSSLQAKERELTEAMDRFLQEKVGAAKTQGELAAVNARLESAQQHISSLKNKLSNLRAKGESKTGDDTLRELELEQLRRQLHQLQTSSEQQRSTASQLMRERQELETTVSRLQSEVTVLQRKSSRDRESLCELHKVVEKREEEVMKLQQQLASMHTPSSTTMLPEGLLQAKLMKLYAKYREAEVHRKALVFQKNYLKCQVDAFFQTQQAALVIMAEMGAPAANSPKAMSKRCHLLKFKTAVHAVMAALRFQYVVRRKHQYIQSYSNRIEREKANIHATPGTATGERSNRPAVGILSSDIPLQHQSTTTPAPTVVVSSQTMSSSRSKHSTLPLHSRSNTAKPALFPARLHPHHSQNGGHPTTATEPPLSTYIPSLARLQAKLSGTVN